MPYRWNQLPTIGSAALAVAAFLVTSQHQSGARYVATTAIAMYTPIEEPAVVRCAVSMSVGGRQ